jgi:P4 family phage/plasmid primase-like protien
MEGIIQGLSVAEDSPHKPITHTLITGGKLHVPQDKLPFFYKKLIKYGLEKGESIPIVEKMGHVHPFLVDIDIKYDQDITERQYTQETVYQVVAFLWSQLALYLDLSQVEELGEVWILEKERPYPCTNKTTYRSKDGIHIIFPKLLIQKTSYKALIQQFKTTSPIETIFKDTCTLAPSNQEDTLFDGCFTSWQPYGCGKPKESPYRLTSVYTIQNDTPVLLEEELFQSLYGDHLMVAKEMSVVYREEETVTYLDPLRELVKGLKSRPLTQCKKPMNDVDIYGTNIYYADNQNIIHPFKIVEEEKLKFIRGVNSCLSCTRASSYDSWLRTGMCLHNINESLLEDWKAFSRQDASYDEEACDAKWRSFGNHAGEKLGIGSLIHWAKEDDPEAFKKVKTDSVESYVDNSVKKGPEADYLIAMVIYKFFADEYISVDVRNEWYTFNGTRWERTMEGESLKKAIHTDIYNLYYEYQALYRQKMEDALSDPDLDEDTRKDIQAGKTKEGRWLKNIQDIQMKLLSDKYVNTLMNSLKGLFYKKDIMEQFDTNLGLLGFENGVFDLKMYVFREGRPEDYLTMSTGVTLPVKREDLPMDVDQLVGTIELIPNYDQLSSDFMDFFTKIIPDEDTRQYTRRFISKCLSGENRDEGFYIWTGSGGNGKSKLVDLIVKSLGSYACNLPVALLTQKRKSSGAADPEMARTRGRRFVYMQEPDVNETLNVGEMKELTGNDTIQARSLFKEPFEFIPQFKLILMCNELPKIPSNDDGTWRRLQAVPFISRFVGEDHVDEEEHRYLIDKELKTKLPFWVLPMYCMLFKEWCEYDKHGINIPKSVSEKTNEYRNENDLVGQWITEQCEEDDNQVGTDGVSEFAPGDFDTLHGGFKDWCEIQEVSRGVAPDRTKFMTALLKWQRNSRYGLKKGKKSENKPNGYNNHYRFNLKIS